jgi:Exoribonuclease R
MPTCSSIAHWSARSGSVPEDLKIMRSPRVADISRSISEAERRAMAAERETADRLIALHLADRIGATFEGRVAGVTRSGLFVKLKDTGADGFVPISTLGSDFFNHDEASHALVGSRTGVTYRLGDQVTVRLVEAIPTAGALRFEMLSEATHERTVGPRRFLARRSPGQRRTRH